jgi:hypothetical protein
MAQRENNRSEVRHILKQIETEYLASRNGLTGFAEGAKHAAITARMENMGRLHEHLQAIVGEKAIGLIAHHLETLQADERREKHVHFSLGVSSPESDSST